MTTETKTLKPRSQRDSLPPLHTLPVGLFVGCCGIHPLRWSNLIGYNGGEPG